MNKDGLTDVVYNHLLKQMLDGNLKPGEKIAESKVAAQFQTSRTPIREAMRRLESRGLIEIYPSRFAQVAVFSEKQIKDIGIVRISLDVLAIKLASLYASKVELLSLKDIAKKCIEAKQNNDTYLSQELDAKFHQELCRLSKNELLYNTQQDLSLKVQFILQHYNMLSPNDHSHLNEHIEMVDSMISGNIQHALQVCVKHLVDFYNVEITNPEEFFIGTGGK